MRGWRAVLRSLCCVLLALSAACGGQDPSSRTYKDPGLRFIFEVPDGWNLYPDARPGGLAILADAERGSRVPFDGFPQANPANLTTPLSQAPYPLGAAGVRPITEEERDLVSRLWISQTVLPYQQEAGFEEVFKEDYEQADDFEGIRLLVQYREDETNELAAVFMEALTDPEDTTLYSIAVGCSVECFRQHQGDIAEVVSSWKVNTNR